MILPLFFIETQYQIQYIIPLLKQSQEFYPNWCRGRRGTEKHLNMTQEIGMLNLPVMQNQSYPALCKLSSEFDKVLFLPQQMKNPSELPRS